MVRTSALVIGTAPTATYEPNDVSRPSVSCALISLGVPGIDGEHSLVPLLSTPTATYIVTRQASMINESSDTRSEVLGIDISRNEDGGGEDIDKYIEERC